MGDPPINVAFDPDMSSDPEDWSLGRIAFETWRQLTVNDQREWFALTAHERVAWRVVAGAVEQRIIEHE